MSGGDPGDGNEVLYEKISIHDRGIRFDALRYPVPCWRPR